MVEVERKKNILSGIKYSTPSIKTTTIGLGVAFSSFAVLHKLSDKRFRKGVKRQAFFWWKMLPVYYHYRAIEWYAKVRKINGPNQRELYEPLHEWYAPRALEVILKLRGFYIKIGQVASCRADALPWQYLREMSTLQDGVPGLPFNVIKRIIETELGQNLDQIFRKFDPQPLGAASIGQVHGAILLDGTPVVVKVMYPDVEEMFQVDLRTIRKFCRMIQPEHLPALSEVEKQFMTEFDYRSEAENMKLLHASVTPLWGDQISIPTPVLATKRVLVMTRIEGSKLISALQSRVHDLSRATGISEEDLIRRSTAGGRKSLSPPAADGVDLTWLWRKTALLSYQSLVAVQNTCVSVYNVAAYVVNETSRLFGEAHTDEPVLKYLKHNPSGRTGGVVDIEGLLRTLVHVHGHEIFAIGTFNGDPHPGNILLTPEGKLGLIDYGQVKRLSASQRLLLAKLIVALERGTCEDIAEIYVAMGFRSKHMHPETIARHAFLAYCTDDRETLGVNAQTYRERLHRADPVRAVPTDYVMAGRVALLLRGMGYAVGYNIRISKEWLPYAEKELRRQGEDAHFIRDGLPSTTLFRPDFARDKVHIDRTLVPLIAPAFAEPDVLQAEALVAIVGGDVESLSPGPESARRSEGLQ